VRPRGRRDREGAEGIRQQDQAAREAREAADAAAREWPARLEGEIVELAHRRDIARISLERMSEQLNEAVAALAAHLPEPGLRAAR
jgi:hypothetical protein